MSPDITAVHGFVSGRVQGVGFRYSTVRKASSLKVSGWVRNTAEGRVEFFAQGNSSAVRNLLQWLNKGPSMARVDGVDYDTIHPRDNITSFHVAY